MFHVMDTSANNRFFQTKRNILSTDGPLDRPCLMGVSVVAFSMVAVMPALPTVPAVSAVSAVIAVIVIILIVVMEEPTQHLRRCATKDAVRRRVVGKRRRVQKRGPRRI